MANENSNENNDDFNKIDPSSDDLEAIYYLANYYYKISQYNQAITLFNFLVYLDPSDHRFSMGLGASYQMLGEYQQAVEFYVASYFTELKKPEPLFYSSECFLKLGKKEEAIGMLKKAKELCELTGKSNKISKKINNYLELLA
jgi:type III secretion system low calcium response chaperone LcrH/SycD